MYVLLLFLVFSKSIYYVSVVEDIHKKREPLSTMEAVYLITPSEKSVQALMNDFTNSNRCMYRAAHCYFTEGKSHKIIVIIREFIRCEYVLHIVL